MKPLLVFDLDDTLYTERRYVESAWHEIARLVAVHTTTPASEIYQLMAQAPNAFDALLARFPQYTIEWCLDIYRTHKPRISLAQGVADMLRTLYGQGYPMAIITEGRTLTQSNKIEALGVGEWLAVPPFIIDPKSEYNKASGAPFRMLQQAVKAPLYIYVGDNPAKDFYWPRRLGWLTLGLKDAGENIHPQRLDDFPADHHPHLMLDTLIQIPRVLQQDY